MTRKFNRRDFLRVSAGGTAGLIVAACAPAAPPAQPTSPPQVIEVTRVVEGTPMVEVVTATPAVATKPPAEKVLGTIPREETVICDILTGRVGDPGNFNTWVGWKWQDRGIQQLSNEPLWEVDFATGEIIAAAADGDPIYNEDFTQLDIKLRQGVTWSDGEPFTADDVVFTIETLMSDKGFNDNAVLTTNVKTVSAKDPHTVHFELNAPNSRFHTRFLDRWGCTWFMPKHIFEKETDKVNFTFNPNLGFGPYKLHSFDPQGMWTIWEKRADWDKSPTGILYGEPKAQYVVFQTFDNEGAKILAQLTHKADYLNLTSDGLKALLAQSKTARAFQPTFPYVVNTDPCITGIRFNCMRAPFDLPDVRWALTLAIDIVDYTGLAVDGSGTLSPVHIPHLSAYPKDYIEPMQDWLKEFTLDLGDGESYKPYDTSVIQRLVDRAKERGYTFPEDAANIEKTFGLGWWKYDPDAAGKLLKKNGFSQDDNGKWLLPDGQPWTITFMTGTEQTHHAFKNAMAAVAAWRKFGIDAVQYPTESESTLTEVGDFEVSGAWPAPEPWGAGSDLYKVFEPFHSRYFTPVGEKHPGITSRWNSPEMDKLIDDLRMVDPTKSEQMIELGREGLKILVAAMPGIPTYGYTGFIGWDEYYWTNWPGSENPYTQPYAHWGPFKIQLTGLKPAA